MNKKDRKARRKEKRKNWELGKDVAEITPTKQINQYAPIIDDIPDYGDKLKENLLFSFVHYKENLCGLNALNPNNSKKLVRILKKINNTTISELPSSKLIKDNVVNSGKYSVLYKKLSPDVEIKEIGFSKSGRIFAYFVERFVCIVAINPNHF